MTNRISRFKGRTATRGNRPGAVEMFDALEPRQLLATFTVTSIADAGAGTLRQAVFDANATTEADVIEFDSSLALGTVTLTSGEIPITSPMTIRGTDASGEYLGIAVSGNNASRIFNINDGTGSEVAVSITDMILLNGSFSPVNPANGGGAIVNLEALTLDRTTIQLNTVATLGQGGALLNYGTTVIRDSFFWGNSAVGNGGAVFNLGGAGAASMTIINSTFHNNTATQAGGAIFQQSSGVGASLVVLNSTINGNIADSNGTGTADFIGGGIGLFSTNSTLLLSSTIVSNNSRLTNGGGTVVPDELNLRGGSVIDAASSHNLIMDAATSDALMNGVNNNIVGQDPLFRNMGAAGGTTWTLSLESNSPAIDAGTNSSGLSNDQRGNGFVRVNGAAPDIGAFEVQPISFVVDNAGDAFDGRYGPGQLSLREAIGMTNNNTGADAITFDSSLSGSTVLLTGQLNITDDLTLTGLGAGNLAIDGNAAGRVFLVDDLDGESNHTVSISGLTVQNGAPGLNNFGGGIANEEDLTLTDVVVTGNTLVNGNGDQGAGIYNGNNSLAPTQTVIGNLTLINSTVSNNTNGLGAGIFSDGNMTLTDSTISGNVSDGSGGGLLMAGPMLTVSGTTISGNTAVMSGGGVSGLSGTATFTFTGSTISGNTAGTTGGGVALTFNGSVEIVNSTISGNTATGNGGGLYMSDGTGAVRVTNSAITGNTSSAGGGGIAMRSQNLTLTNSTVSGNTSAAGGGGILDGSGGGGALSMDILNSTIAFNHDAGGLGGGIFANGFGVISHTLTSTIVSDNTSGAGAGAPDDIRVGAGAIDLASSNNLIGDAATAGGLTDGTNGNIVGRDARLVALANNGGPTMTHALRSDSPARDAGSASTSLNRDQRGSLFVRNFGDAPDIGAYERQTLALVVDNAGDADDGDVSDGQLSLREAINASNANPLDDSITFDASLSGSTITLTGGFITISDDVTIAGPGFDDLTISGDAASRHFVVNDSNASSVINVTLSGLTLTNGMTTANGGAITNDENLTLDNMKIVNNSSANDGGAIINRNTLTIVSTIISNNTAGDSGGAIDNDGTTTVTISGSSIKNNTAGGAAGAIDNDANGSLTITFTSISGNTAGSHGGAIDNGGTLSISNAALNDNVSTDPVNGFGGAIQNQAGATLTLTNATLSNNSGVSSGGAIENNGTTTITNSTLDGNTATDSGGAIDNFGGVLTITGSTLSNNMTAGSGGAIWTDTELTIRNSTISGNSAGDFGGGIGMFDGTVVIDNSTIAFNTADANDDSFGKGGAIDVGKRNGAGTLTTTSTIYANNFLGSAGTTLNDITLTDGTVTGNNNLVRSQSTSGGLTNGVNGNLVGADPNLGALADNGGPTATHTIFPGSPAFNAGFASGGVATDQRGLARTNGSDPDIGAYEWAPTSNFSLAVLNGSRSQSTSISGDTHVTVIRNADGDLVAMTGNASVWTAQRIRDYTAAPVVTSDPVVWTDPNDGLVYVAAPSADGFILHRRAADGTWSFRNLSTEFSVSNADSPLGVLTFFISRPRTGDALVSVAGITGLGEIVAFQQSTAASSNAEAAWTFYNITDDLNSQTGMTTPAFTQMTSYVTSWNQWTLAGLDASGNVQGVWVNVAQFTTWRVDNLSTITGADPLTGELDVTLTTWGGIRFSGADTNGNLIATWWNPGLGGGNWKQTDLTSKVTGTAPTLSGGRLTAWFATGNRISYAGFNSSGDVLSYYWQPSDGATWNADNLTEFVTDNSTRPTGAITAYVSTAGTVSIVAADSNNNLVRLWSPTGEENTFSLDNLSNLAVRI